MHQVSKTRPWIHFIQITGTPFLCSPGRPYVTNLFSVQIASSRTIFPQSKNKFDLCFFTHRRDKASRQAVSEWVNFRLAKINFPPLPPLCRCFERMIWEIMCWLSLPAQWKQMDLSGCKLLCFIPIWRPAAHSSPRQAFSASERIGLAKAAGVVAEPLYSSTSVGAYRRNNSSPMPKTVLEQLLSRAWPNVYGSFLPELSLFFHYQRSVVVLKEWFGESCAD